MAIVKENDIGTSKVRRVEDWRLSHHNATMQTCGRPHHHTVNDLVLPARAMYKRGLRDLHVWVHDHESTYRQLLITRPEFAMIVLLTDLGSTLSMNHVLLFSPTGSVWDYGRVLDYMMYLGRRPFLLAAIFHNVDDFHDIELSDTASSAFKGLVRRVERVGGLPHEGGQKGTSRTHRSSWVSNLTFPQISP